MPGIVKTNRHSRSLTQCGDGELFSLLVLHGAFAVFSQVEKYLHDALPVGPDRRQVRFHLPTGGHPGIPQAAFDHDAQLVQQGLYLDRGRVAGALPQVHGGDAFERQDQRAEGLKVFVFF